METKFQLNRRSLLALAAALPLASRAQSFPARPVKLLLPQPPGGAADVLARLFADKLGARWKQSVVVENKPGGGVVVGTQALARATPDGYTIGLLGSSLSLNSLQRKDLPYAIKDLQPLARVGYYTVALVARTDLPVNNIRELIALARQQPKKLSYGSNGIGTSAHVAGELLNQMAGIEIQHVPYNGASKMYTDMIGGQLKLGFSVASSAEPFIKAGQLKVLGVTSAQRSALFPQWPIIAETLPGYEAVNWAGFFAPAGLPADLTAHIADDILEVLKDKATEDALTKAGVELSPQGPRELQAFIDGEVKRFAPIIQPLATRLQQRS